MLDTPASHLKIRAQSSPRLSPQWLVIRLTAYTTVARHFAHRVISLLLPRLPIEDILPLQRIIADGKRPPHPGAEPPMHTEWQALGESLLSSLGSELELARRKWATGGRKPF